MIEEKLKESGITIPEAAKPLAAYIPANRVEKYVYTSGQLPMQSGALKFAGVVGKDISQADAKEAAQIAAINCLAAVKTVVESLDEIEKIVKLTVFVRSDENFSNQPEVANGASELLQKIFGEAGKHARSAVGVNQLPRGSSVEVEMIVKLR